MSTKTPPTMPDVGDRLHKKRYPEGERIQMTPAWKQLVRDRLAENKENDVYPRNQVELAEAVGASEKSAITKMFKASGSKFVPKVCEVLGIDMPMRETKKTDRLDETLKGRTQEQRDAIDKLIKASGLLD
jgi:hypothetical protein